jgi:hypothetical protein
MDANKLSSLSRADTDEKIGEFWDTHDFTKYDDPSAPDIEFETSHAVPIEPDLFLALQRQAEQRGVQVETLINLWLQQKLAEQPSLAG